MTSSLLSLHAIKKAYGSQTVLDGIDLEVEAGAYLSVMGRSGCGKSTLLNIIGTMDQPDSGEYRFAGRDMCALSEAERAAVRGRQIGFVFQRFHLIPDLSVLENVAMPLGYQGVSKKERRLRAAEALARVGMADKRNRVPAACSGGEQQRIAIARAIVCKPALLIADEPTGNLDAMTAGSVIELLDDLCAAGMTLLLVTHAPEIAAHAKKQLLLEHGQLYPR